MWEWIRYRALILAAMPFVVGCSLWFLSENAGGWDKLGFLIVLILSMPFLAVMAAFSVVFAFRQDDALRRLNRTSKIASVFSLTVFGGLALMGAAGVVQSLWFPSGR
jgi:1,4-dihydroxy-2-naphthoate octaprenyltransferase